MNDDEKQTFTRLLGLAAEVDPRIAAGAENIEKFSAAIRFRSPLLVGLMSELSRQMRKMLKASVEPNQHKRLQAFSARNAEVPSLEISDFIEMYNTQPGTVESRQKEILNEIANGISKIKQYAWATTLLNSASKIKSP